MLHVIQRNGHDCSALDFDFDFDIVARHADIVFRDVVGSGQGSDFARPDIEPRGVPRTLDLVAVDFPLALRPAGVRTGVVDGEEFSPEIEQRDALVRDLDQFAGVLGYFGGGGDFDEFAHGLNGPRRQRTTPLPEWRRALK